MGLTVSPNQSDIQKALGKFMQAILPDDVEIMVGQPNRVAEPKAASYVVMIPTLRGRLSTNLDDFVDVRFVGAIAFDVLTVTELSFGVILSGATVFGEDVAAQTRIVSQMTGATGGLGTYRVEPSQNVSSEVMAAGSTRVTQPTRVTQQIDIHGPGATDNAQIIATMMRDAYAVAAFAALNPHVSPLYAEDPRRLPFVNGEQQYEDRWVVDAHLQANQTVSVPQQAADVVDLTIVSVEATYPAS